MTKTPNEKLLPEREAMTVAQLIESLSKLPGHYSVHANVLQKVVIGIVGATDIGGDYFSQVFLENFDHDEDWNTEWKRPTPTHDASDEREFYAKEIIEIIWAKWYGQRRGNANVDQMGDILSDAKKRIISRLEQAATTTPSVAAGLSDEEMVEIAAMPSAKDVGALVDACNKFFNIAVNFPGPENYYKQLNMLEEYESKVRYALAAFKDGGMYE